MEKLINTSLPGVLLIIGSAVGVYIAVIGLTRICGKRSFSKMSSFDFAMTIAVGSIMATTILSNTVTLTEGIVGLVSVYALQMTAAFARRNRTVQNLIDNTPLLLMDGEKVLFDNLRKARVAECDLRAKLREANVVKMSQVKAVIFETTGDISVLHVDEDITPDYWIIKDVKRA